MNIGRVHSPGGGKTGLGSKLLHDGWQLHEKGNVESIYNAIVPGNVRTTLIAAGVIPDPFIGKNNDESKWVSDVEWVYKKQVDVEGYLSKIGKKSKDNAILHVVFDAIDYDATFHACGKKICRQTGMFSPVDIALGTLAFKNIMLDGTNGWIPIEILFHVQPWWRQHAVKSQMAFEWDFAPDMRTIGLWKDVRIHHTGPAFFTSVNVVAKPVSNEDANKVRVSARCAVAMRDPETLERMTGRFTVKFNVETSNVSIEREIELKPNEPFTIDIGRLDIPLWQPWSIGQQYMEPITIKMHVDGELTDEYRGTVFNREVEWKTTPGTLRGNENWTFMINGNKMFMRGINWVPPDSLYGRLNGERYGKLIDAAKDMNIDILRVWGGGIEEKPEFYDYCDEVGMMVWQEFPFACTNYPNESRYLQIVGKELDGIVERTRHHPSVVVYCGGNEYNPFINSHIISIAEHVVASRAPSTHFFKASPFSGDDHNWRVFGKGSLLQAFDINARGRVFKMLTEFGIQAAPATETLEECLPRGITPDDVDVDSALEFLQYHKADVNCILKFANKFSKNITSLPEMIKVSQEIQAYTLKYAIEACRSGWPNVTGVFPWQLSDPWPNISWSIIDHNFRPKLATKSVKRAYNPILPMVRSWKKSTRGGGSRKGTLIVHNSTQNEFTGSLHMEITSPGEKTVYKTYAIKASPDCALKVTTITARDSPGTRIHMELKDASGKTTCRNFHFPAMEPLFSRKKIVTDMLSARFDGWWRRHMTGLMRLEKQREEFKEWCKKKEERAEGKGREVG
ncbi:MAG: glycosyl hydrolase 2 galactose-binding domain-containing protein [Promethearchaeota archaeon]